MAALAGHAEERHAPPDGRLLRYRDGQPITYRRYDGLWVRVGRHLPWARAQQVSTHWLRHTGSATSTYVRATITEVATALAALTGEPHPLA